MIPADLVAVYPNPADKVINVDYQLSETGHTTLYLIDNSGRTIRTFFEIQGNPGFYEYEALTENLSSGAYFLVLMTPNESFTEKIIIKK